MMRFFIAIFIFIMLFISLIFIPFNISNTVIIIEPGKSTGEIVHTLKEENIILSELHGKLATGYFALKGKYLKFGEYEFTENKISIFNVITKLIEGKVKINMVTIPEGLTNYEIYKLLESLPKLKGEITYNPKEGYLMPETYDYVYGEKRNDLIKKMERKQKEFLNIAWKERNPTLSTLKTFDEIIIFASIVEKETGFGVERDLVSSVYHNRLMKNMILQADPTIIYALTNGKGKLDRKLLRSDLQIDSKYNTYKYSGLPPTAICNPGKASIIATLNPAKTNYIYFVTSGSGGHNFSETLKEHNENVRKLRILERLRNKK
ncbi:MAG: endolytic transglycosylase MltG [Sphingobacteriia bacterium]|nr:endolytic transglycosylase MltG [Sphingobacteriia bacterium]